MVTVSVKTTYDLDMNPVKCSPFMLGQIKV